ncbi:MAG: hypothetical protein ACXAD7_03610 [Candidatus Kariarchaeaceae archaeon]|jgi:hypothetical protein
MVSPTDLLITLDATESIVTSLITTILAFLLLPVLIRIIINLIIDLINTIFGLGQWRRRSFFDFGTIVRFVAFPGTLIRGVIVFYTLHTMGWRVKTGSAFNVGRPMGNFGSRDRSYRGYYLAMIPPSGITPTLREVIYMALVGYLVQIVVFVMYGFRQSIQQWMLYIWGPKFPFFRWGIPINWVFWYLFLALVIGGLPVPEETLYPIYYILVAHPQLILMTIFNLLAASIFVGLYGPNITMTIFTFSMAMGFYLDTYLQHKLDQLKDSSFGLEIMEMVEVDEFGIF